MRFWSYLVTLLVTLLVLVGCASLKKPVTELPAYSGKLSLQIHSNPPQFFSAGFTLVGTADKGDLELLTPMGTTAARLAWTPQQAELTANGTVRAFDSAEDALEKLSGAALPLAAVFSWLGGKAATPEPRGWTADLSRQTEGRISAKRNIPLPAVELRVVLEQ